MIGVRGPVVDGGRPFPLGATWDGKGVNFALFSANAERVELCLFGENGRRELHKITLPKYTDGVWHGYVSDARPGLLYGYRVHGPYDPSRGHRFNAAKLLLDPYAKQIAGSIKWSDAQFGYRLGGPRGDLVPDKRDDASGMPKSVVVDTAFTWGDDAPPRTPWRDTVIYETHVRGFTMQLPGIPPPLRGTFLALSSPPALEYVKRLGVTAVELLPIHAYVDDRNLVEKRLRNYWGYNSIGFFAPHPLYLSADNVAEFKTMVMQFHDAGLEVLLDVVYNHTAEGNHEGPTLSFKGIDNASYYRLMQDKRYYDDSTGCGNSMDLEHPRTLQLVMDSLRYWVQEMHVDGFRFDLAPTLGRGPQGFDPRGSFLQAVSQDPVLSQVKMIAEPWDVGLGGYQVGNFPAGWSEWNGKYRDVIRRFWQGNDGVIPELASRVSGSADVFAHAGRHLRATVNFVTAHDGFTLADLVSYNEKHNDANGEGNRDGASDNASWNCGAEGPTDNPGIIAMRRRQQRNFLATLLLSQGVPMLLAGDEVGKSQGGNNNVYCQDSPIAWFDWASIDDPELHDFTEAVLRLRAGDAAFRRESFFSGVPVAGTLRKDLTWLRPEGGEMGDFDWHDGGRRAVGMMFGADKVAPGDPLVLLWFNAHDAELTLALPEHAAGWELLIDTAGSPSTEVHAPVPVGRTLPMQARSFIALRTRPGTPA